MREIISIFSGSCGNKIGLNYMESICKEHGITNDGQFKGQEISQIENINVCFRQTSYNRFIPRTILTDLEPYTTEDHKKQNPFHQLIHPDNEIYGEYGAGNSFPKGHYTEGPSLIDQLLESIRKESEKCDTLQGFQLMHSLGGGTGSGFGTLLLAHLREDYSDRLIQTFSVMTSSNVSDCVVEPYNAVLALNQLTYNSDICTIFDNEALYRMVRQQLKIKTPHLPDLNYIVNTAMTGITRNLRFTGQFNSDLRKLNASMIPIPLFHFLIPAVAPITKINSPLIAPPTLNEMCSQILNPLNVIAEVKDIQKSKCFSASSTFKSNFSMKEIDEHMGKIIHHNKDSHDDFKWISESKMKVSIFESNEEKQNFEATALFNSTSIKDIFKRVSDQFQAMFKRKAFLFAYCRDGLDEMELTEAIYNMQIFMEECQHYEDGIVELDNQGDDTDNIQEDSKTQD